MTYVSNLSSALKYSESSRNLRQSKIGIWCKSPSLGFSWWFQSLSRRYLGRKRLEDSDSEHPVEGTERLVRAGYSYWTLGYALSRRGAQKLLSGEPLRRLVPVDEYLPIMSDRHPKQEWKEHFPNRNLVVLSASPLLLYPMRYTGEEGYISDTEDSLVVEGVCESCREDL